MNHRTAPLAILTPRLELLAATAESARAAIADKERFAELLGAAVPNEWPPGVLEDVQELCAQWLESGQAAPGWSHWFIVRLPTEADPRRVLIGSAGNGPPRTDADETPVEIGYAILPPFEGCGYASEATRALVDWLFHHPQVQIIRAHTFERHVGSIRVLQRAGFTCAGVSPGDAEAAESDRQGRGRLMLYELTRTAREQVAAAIA